MPRPLPNKEGSEQVQARLQRSSDVRQRCLLLSKSKWKISEQHVNVQKQPVERWKRKQAAGTRVKTSCSRIHIGDVVRAPFKVRCACMKS